MSIFEKQADFAFKGKSETSSGIGSTLAWLHSEQAMNPSGSTASSSISITEQTLTDSTQLVPKLSSVHRENRKLHFGVEGETLTGWKWTDTHTSRVIAINAESVILECLVDKEEGIIIEQEYARKLFDGIELSIGKVIALWYYERKNSQMLKVVDRRELIDLSAFPSTNFAENYKNFDADINS